MAEAILKKEFAAGKRFGARYGRKLRHKFVALENLKKANTKCPSCHYSKVYRLAVGVWACKKCKVKFTGRAYTPQITGKIQDVVLEQFGLSKQNLEAAEQSVSRLESDRVEKKKARDEAKKKQEEEQKEAVEVQISDGQL